MTKDTKIHESESADSVRGSRGMQSFVAGGDIAPQRWGDRHKRPLLSPNSPNGNQVIDKDKEYTNIDKEAKCICGIFYELMPRLGANAVARSVQLIGCNVLAVTVSSVATVQKNCLPNCVKACRSEWGASS